MWAMPHAAAPPVGSPEYTVLPTESTATQKETDGHETPRNRPGPPPYGLGSVMLLSTRATVHAEAGPAGSPVAAALPTPSTATHTDAEGQERAVNELLASTSSDCHPLAPPDGSVELKTRPSLSTATQSEIDGQASPSRPWLSIPIGAAHTSGPLARVGPGTVFLDVAVILASS